MWMWVRIPVLSNNADTVLYMYYGGGGIPGQQDPENVWDSHYKMVLHFDETSRSAGAYNDHEDSTVNSNSAEAQASMEDTMDTEGLIDGADDFDGVSDYLTTDDFYVTNITISCWVNPTNMSFINAMFYQADTSVKFQFHADKYHFKIVGTDAPADGYISGDLSGRLRTWFQAALTYDGSTVRSYVDGIEEDTNPNGSGHIVDIAGIWYIGNYSSGRFAGVMDEMRISDTARSAGWLKTSHTNQIAPHAFATFGAEEESAVMSGMQPWPDSLQGWNYRQKITIMPSSPTLTNFPALLTEDIVRSGLWIHANTNGSDILFTDDDGETKLSHEIEMYETNTPQMDIWVKVPTIDPPSFGVRLNV